MRISYWSSDVCSSDLTLLFQLRADPRRCRHSAQPRGRRRPYRALRVAGAGVLIADRAPPPAPEDEDEGRSVRARLLLRFGFGLASLALFAAAIVVVLDTVSGRRFVADQIQRVALGSSLPISTGRTAATISSRS